ncbi:MAG: EAL domain-containing protein [Thiomicrospira sp.]|nr:EAL domain-containing protein [Thiomicrospira sp.]
MKQNDENQTRLKFSYAENRVVTDIEKTKLKLEEGVNQIAQDKTLHASIALVNNYQDKQNYNAILLDEEKKIIANILLEKVKNAFNHFISLYDQNEELIAFVYENEKGYSLNFISYENGEKVLFSKQESEDDYKKLAYHAPHSIKFKHLLYYTQPQLKHGSLVTYHYLDNSLYIIAHESTFKENSDKTFAHFEMADRLNSGYFKSVSDELNVNLSMTSSPQYKDLAQPLFTAKQRQTHFIESAQDYQSIYSFSTEDSPLYLLLEWDKTHLNKALTANRKQLLLFLLLMISVALFIAYQFLKIRLSIPINHLMQQIAKIKQGDYSPTPLVKTGDELEDISSQINELAQTIDHRESELKISHEHLEYVSTHDSLTELGNRSLFNLELEYALNLAKHHSRPLAVMFLDLDQFKQINDTLGHDVGDTLLQKVAERLKESLHQDDGLARIGGDEFNIFTNRFHSRQDLERISLNIIRSFEPTFKCFEHEINISTSIGIAVYPDHGQDAITLTKNADLAMYMAKDNGRNNYCFYSKNLSDSIERRTEIIQALKVALKIGNEFRLHYQPKIDIHTKKVVGAEALLRWNSASLGQIYPDEFISIAEETHLIIEIGQWVLNQACSDWSRLKDAGINLDQISVNVSNIQLQYSDMLSTVKAALKATNMPAKALELEVTESYIATNEQSAIQTLGEFRKMGIDLAIDDFGTGYSSMNYLQQLPITRLKIDKSFVDEVPDSNESVAVVNAIMALAQTFNLKVTVEGLETQTQLAFFEKRRCHDIQGYYFSKPLPFLMFQDFIKTHS